MEYYELYHHGILGQRWGVRRYQNYDGSYTEEGKKHRNSNSTEASTKNRRSLTSKQKKIIAAAVTSTLAAATVASVAVYAAKHPESIVKAKRMISAANKSAKDFVKKNTVEKGKSYISKIKANKAELEAIQKMSAEELAPLLKTENARSQYTKIVLARQAKDSLNTKTGKILKGAGTVAVGTSTALTLYNNILKLHKIAKDTTQKTSKNRKKYQENK